VVIDAREWTPYGVEVGTEQAGLRYTGEWGDAALGMTYLRARWYDEQVGRFARMDPWDGSVLHPQTLGRYTYVTNQPVDYTDPWGLWPTSDAQTSESLVDLIRSDFNVEIDVDYMPPPEERPVWAYRNLDCEDNLWISGELATVWVTLAHIEAFLGTARFDAYIGGQVAFRRVHTGLHDNPHASVARKSDPRSPAKYSTSVVELTTDVFGYPRLVNQSIQLHTIMHELFHVYSYGHPVTLRTDFAQAAGWTNIDRAFCNLLFRWHAGIWSNELVAERILKSSGVNNRETTEAKYGFMIDFGDTVPVPYAKYYGKSSIDEDFAESSTGFALLWLGQQGYGLAAQAFQNDINAQQVLYRPGAQTWLEEHYERYPEYEN
jgi:RHS repeat-associated protein